MTIVSEFDLDSIEATGEAIFDAWYPEGTVGYPGRGEPPTPEQLALIEIRGLEKRYGPLDPKVVKAELARLTAENTRLLGRMRSAA